jgi:hypothetical protein
VQRAARIRFRTGSRNALSVKLIRIGLTKMPSPHIGRGGENVIVY